MGLHFSFRNIGFLSVHASPNRQTQPSPPPANLKQEEGLCASSDIIEAAPEGSLT